MTESPNPDEATLSEGELKLLGKLDERTERIDSKVESVVDATEENAGKISSNEKKIKRNTTILTGFSTGFSALILWGADKVGRFI